MEDSHRIPANWWDMRYSGLEENGKPKQPEFAKCGKNVKSIHEMTDDVPEQEANEPCKLHCCDKIVIGACVELDVDGIHPDLGLRVIKGATDEWDAEKMKNILDNMGEKKLNERSAEGLLSQRVTNHNRVREQRQALRQSSSKWALNVRSHDKKYSRNQLMSSIVLEGGTLKKVILI